MRKLLAISAAALTLIVAARESHAVVTFEYNSTCASNCSLIGLDTGDAVFGTISFRDSVVVPGATLIVAGPVLPVGFSFDLDFGTVDIALATAASFSFVGTLNSTASAFTSFDFATSETVFPNFGETIAFDASQFLASEDDGTCLTAGSCIGFFLQAAVGDPGTLTRILDVAEPVSLALLGPGLGLAFAGRRRVDHGQA